MADTEATVETVLEDSAGAAQAAFDQIYQEPDVPTGAAGFLSKLGLDSFDVTDRLLTGNFLAVCMAATIAAILVYIMYKIVSRQSNREKAREAKKKLKQQRNQKDSPKGNKKKN